ncbi:MAG: hypothetical protein E7648_03735 [Ruminococcaceae bacterium]|nr:hypothetical protein [Oscillospiraceae bacterium]
MILQAHMGVSKRYPENTMLAYRAAYEEGYKIIELDMKYTKDDVCVAIHDFSIARHARNVDGSPLENDINVIDLSYSELLNYDYGIAKSEKFKGTKLPTLKEILDFACETKMKLKFDNVIQKFTEAQLNLFFDEIEERDQIELFGFTSNDLAFVQKVAKRFPTCAIHYDGPVDKESLDKLKEIAPNNTLYIWMPLNKISWLSYPPADKEQVELARKYGYVGLWIIDDPNDLPRCKELGADVVETNGGLTVDML